MVFVLHFVNMVRHIDFRMLNHPCVPPWSSCIILLMCYLNKFASILLSIFVSISYSFFVWLWY